MSDEEIRAGVLAGDAAAIRLFVRQFAPIFLRVIRGRMPRDRSPADAEDVLQEILLLITRPPADGRSPLSSWDPAGGRSLRSYLTVFVHNRAIDAIRRRYEAPTDDPPPSEQPAGEQALSLEIKECLQRVIERFRAEASADDVRLFELIADEAATETMMQALSLRQDAVFARVARLKKWLRSLKHSICG